MIDTIPDIIEGLQKLIEKGVQKRKVGATKDFDGLSITFEVDGLQALSEDDVELLEAAAEALCDDLENKEDMVDIASELSSEADQISDALDDASSALDDLRRRISDMEQ